MHFHFRAWFVFTLVALAPAAPARAAGDDCKDQRAKANWSCMECQQAKKQYDEGQSALAKQIRKPNYDQKKGRFQLDMLGVQALCKDAALPCSECEGQ